ncbi:MAG: type II toxin-antitoxin system ParD family antitoxin [Gemmatales bacterium]
MPVKPIVVSAKQQRFIASEIKAGHYRSESDVVKAGLELLERQKRVALQREALKKEIQLGIDELDAGLGVTRSSREELTAFLDELAMKAGVPIQKYKKRA